MNREEPLEIEDSRLELENRIRNLLWTVSGDYKLDMKPDISLFLRSRAIALYDGIKQGALARFYDKDLLGLYLVKKVFLQAGEGELTAVAQLCIEEAIGEKICEERPGIRSMQREAFEDILDQEFEEMPSQKDLLGRLKVAVLRRRLDGGEYRVERRMVPFMELVIRAGKAKDTMELIRVIDELYNALVDPMFERLHGNLERVLAVTLEELTEYSWEDFLSEEMYEEALESYVEQLTTNMAGMEDRSVTEEMEERYDIYYRVHAQNFGWMGWTKNGESAGTEGYGYRVEAIQIKIVKKGAQAPGTTEQCFSKKWTSIVYSAHVQDIGWQNNVKDGALAGTTGESKRVEAIKISLSGQKAEGSVEYSAHVQDIGWQKSVKDGALAGTTGKGKRVEAIKINLTGTLSESCDVYYRVHAQDHGWLGWTKNGNPAGTEGLSKRIEAIEIKVVTKGDTAPEMGKEAFVKK